MGKQAFFFYSGLPSFCPTPGLVLLVGRPPDNTHPQAKGARRLNRERWEGANTAGTRGDSPSCPGRDEGWSDPITPAVLLGRGVPTSEGLGGSSQLGGKGESGWSFWGHVFTQEPQTSQGVSVPSSSPVLFFFAPEGMPQPFIPLFLYVALPFRATKKKILSPRARSLALMGFNPAEPSPSPNGARTPFLPAPCRSHRDAGPKDLQFPYKVQFPYKIQFPYNYRTPSTEIWTQRPQDPRGAAGSGSDPAPGARILRGCAAL